MIREENETDGFLAGLIERYAPTTPEFLFVTTKGDYFRFRHVEGHDELVSLRRSARDFIGTVTRQEYPESWREIVPTDRDTLLYVFHIAALNTEWGVVHPAQKGEADATYESKGRLRQLDVLTIASRAPHLFDALKAALDEKMHVAAVTFDANGIEAAKKKSSPTGSTGNGSPPAEPSGDATPTS